MYHLIADIGGTNARFQIVTKASVEESLTLPVADFSDSEELLTTALSQFSRSHPHQVHIAVAGRKELNRISLTNGTLVFDVSILTEMLGEKCCVKLYNDVEAAALGLPLLSRKDILPLGTSENVVETNQPIALLNVGTGLGISCYLPDIGNGVALSTEGGHATLPATTLGERKIIAALEQKIGRVSCEHVLSGVGLATLYEVMSGRNAEPPDWVVYNALDGNTVAREVLSQFCAFLGSVAGDIALIYGAWAGVFIGGGIPPRFANFLAESPFRDRFESKGTFGPALRETPTLLVLRDDLALLGLAKKAISAATH